MHHQPLEPGERAVAVGIGTLESGRILLSLLRVAVATEPELEEILSAAGSLAAVKEMERGEEKERDLHDDDVRPLWANELAPGPIGWRNERAAWAALSAIIAAHPA